MSAIDRQKPHVFVTLVRSMEGVERGTGIPGLGVLKRKVVSDAGWELSGFESVDPAERRGPSELQLTLEKLRALRGVIDAEISEIECYGDPDDDDNDDDDDGADLIEDLASHAHFRISDAWSAYEKHYEKRDGR